MTSNFFSITFLKATTETVNQNRSKWYFQKIHIWAAKNLLQQNTNCFLLTTVFNLRISSTLLSGCSSYKLLNLLVIDSRQTRLLLFLRATTKRTNRNAFYLQLFLGMKFFTLLRIRKYNQTNADLPVFAHRTNPNLLLSVHLITNFHSSIVRCVRRAMSAIHS